MFSMIWRGVTAALAGKGRSVAGGRLGSWLRVRLRVCGDRKTDGLRECLQPRSCAPGWSHADDAPRGVRIELGSDDSAESLTSEESAAVDGITFAADYLRQVAVRDHDAAATLLAGVRDLDRAHWTIATLGVSLASLVRDRAGGQVHLDRVLDEVDSQAAAMAVVTCASMTLNSDPSRRN